MELATKEEARRLRYRMSRAPRTPPPAPGPGAALPQATRQWAHQSAQTPLPVAPRDEAATSAAWQRSGSHSQPAAASDPAKQRDADPRPTRPGQGAGPPGGLDRPASEVGPGTLHHSTHHGDSVRVLATMIRKRQGTPRHSTHTRDGRAR